ncbi:hypothetical protein H4R20_001799 [Coemansia guatemalensis]|uniref:Beta-catenin-like protein 1 N-terminal domain-containing protein n=1 Tax=Coemansia guatemalensis TaxID=2761395 RepID=A0A9W8HYV5_9FUNG|nr:hypothetical protein H4R20_001799 [Coemansia guatemalensis]
MWRALWRRAYPYFAHMDTGSHWISQSTGSRGNKGDDNSEGEGEDDEDGRFFSDGLTAEEKGVMTWVDHMEEIEDTLDAAAVQRLVVRLERATSKNTEDRITYAQSPENFVESEAELDEAIQRLLLLANDVQYLRVLDELGALPTLVGLVAHENADIALDVIQLVAELTAEDAWSQEGESQEERAMVIAFVAAMARSEFFEALGQNLRRLNEDPESSEAEADRQGVFQTLTLVENLVSLDVALAEKAAKAMGLLEWLQERIPKSLARDSVQADSNQQYAAEIASILLQASPEICRQAGSAFMDALLQCLAKHRKHTPDDDIEMEYLENIVNSICMLVATPGGKQMFLDHEGVELLVLLQKQHQVGRLLSLKILDHALSPPPPPPSPPSENDNVNQNGPEQNTDKEVRAIAKRYIDGMGLKYLFSTLVHHGKGRMQKLYKKYPECDDHIVSCIAWLLRLTEKGTPTHWRVLAKFVPSPVDPSGWKAHVDRIVELNVAYSERVREAEELFGQDRDLSDEDDDDAAERYLLRMDAGLFSLQMTDIIIAFVSEESQPRDRIEQRLRRKGRDTAAVQSELAEYLISRQAAILGSVGDSSSANSTLKSLRISELVSKL